VNLPGGGRLRGYAARFTGFEPDARRYLLATLFSGAAISLYWIDFNLYLAALGFPPATIGLVATVASMAGALAAFPASALSDRIGRRGVMAGGIGLALLALVGLLVVGASLPLVMLCAATWSAGQQALNVVQAPFLAEHSDPDHRNELFATQSALQTMTNVAAAVLGGVVATAIAASIGLDPNGPGTYRVILAIMTVLLVAALLTMTRLTDDRPGARRSAARLRILGEPAAFPRDRRSRARFGLEVRDAGRFARLLFPGFLIALGAGQVIPFLNLYVRGRFGLDLASLNALFAVTSLGTVAAMLAQPRLARRFGQVASVVIVQSASLPFLAVLGFSPVLWTVILAMAVRNSLMNAGNPIWSAFAMEHVSAAERATLAAAMSVLWQLGWVIGAGWYALLQATLGFDGGYTVNFVTVIALYGIATTLTWAWFRRWDRTRRDESSSGADGSPAGAAPADRRVAGEGREQSGPVGR
jgi:MFS family permease